MKYCALALLLTTSALFGAERWEMQYLYDENKSSLAISDIVFPTPQRGVAVGTLDEGSHTRGAAVVTSDGGAHWSLVRLDAPALSVFFLDDSVGWVVTTKGILQTEEGGRSWRKLPSSPKVDVLRVWFLSAQHGYAVGYRKSIWETKDAGLHWTRSAASDQATSNPKYTVYNNIAFIGKRGMILGFSRPPRWDDSEVPDWMEPDKAARRREWPNMLISLVTVDGGAKWNASAFSMFGEVTRVRLAADGQAFTLVEFQHSFPYPSEVYALTWNGKSGERIYRDKGLAVTDMAVLPDSTVYLAAVEVTGKEVRLPVPGRLHMLRSADRKTWTEMAVDYRASGLRAAVATAGAGDVWVGTDTGMILKLVP